MRLPLIAMAFCLFAIGAQAQEDKQIPAVPTESPPLIDGDLSDGAWLAAPVVSDFHQVQPIEFAQSRHAVRVRVLHDEHFLYVAADVTMADASDITAHKLAQGTLEFTEDLFAVIIDPYNNRRSGYQFGLNPNGVRQEGIFDGPSELNTNWQGIWDGRTRRKDDGWSAEFAIPFKTLNFDPGNETWGISFSLKVFKGDELIAWTSQNRDVRPGTLGAMTGLDRVQQGRGLDVQVSGTTRGSRDHVLGTSDTAFDPSVNVFYKLTPALTAALTLNTDFSATEVDDRVVNLERFSVFFPEKRSFFLQDADIFSFANLRGGRGGDPNGIPFFSRNIGLDERRQPIDIIAGGKLTGRVGRFNLGVLDVLQDGLTQNVNLFVGRATMNVLEESSIGVIVTNGAADETVDNKLTGFDFNYLNRDALGGRALRGSAWYQRSDTSGLTGNQDAYGLYLSVPRTRGPYGDISFRRIGDSFYPALGFVNRPAIRQFEISFGHRRYPSDSYWQFWNHEIEFTHIENLGGDVESQALYFQVFQTGNYTQDWYTLDASWEREVLREPFEIRDGVVIEPGDYRWNRVQFEISSGEQRPLYSRTEISYGDFYDGTRLQIEGEVTWQPSIHFAATAGYDYNDISLKAGSFKSHLYSLRTLVAFNSEWSWITLAQWDNESHELGVNSRLKWIPRTGRDVTLVVNHSRLAGNDADPFARTRRALHSDVILKGTYTFRF